MFSVVIVQDHVMVRDGLTRLLAGTGRFQVIGCAATVRDALVLIRERLPDVIVADLSLQDGNAIDLLRGLKRVRHRARTLVLTECPGDVSASEALRAGASGYIAKVQPTGEVLRALDEVAAGRGYVRSAAAGRPRNARRGAVGGDLWGRLTRREQQIFYLAVCGRASRTIARSLGVTVETVDSQRTKIGHKLGLRATVAPPGYAAGCGSDVADRPPSRRSSRSRSR